MPRPNARLPRTWANSLAYGVYSCCEQAVTLPLQRNSGAARPLGREITRQTGLSFAELRAGLLGGERHGDSSPTTLSPTYNTGRRRHHSDHLWNSGRNRLLCDTCCADLGLDKMDSPTKAASCPGDFVLDRIRFCNSLGRPRGFLGCVCSSSPFFVLRSVAPEDISMRRFAFPRGNHLWHRWYVAAGSAVRWHAPVCGLGMLAFWFVVASGE